MKRTSAAGHGPTSHCFFSQRLRLHYVDYGCDQASRCWSRSRRSRPCAQLGFRRCAPEGSLPRHRARSSRTRGFRVGGRHLNTRCRSMSRPESSSCDTSESRRSCWWVTHSAAPSCSNTPACIPTACRESSQSKGLGPPPSMIVDTPVEERMRRVDHGRWKSWPPDSRGVTDRLDGGRRRACAKRTRTYLLSVARTPHRARDHATGGRHLRLEVRQLCARLGSRRYDRDAVQRLWSRICVPRVAGPRIGELGGEPGHRTAERRTFAITVTSEFEGAGHWVHHDRLEGFLSELQTFLTHVMGQ